MKQINKPVLLFILFTFLINWSFALVYYAAGGRLSGPMGVLFGVIYMFVPMIVAIVLQKYKHRRPLGEIGLRRAMNRWIFVAWFLPVFICLAAIPVSLLLPGVSFTPNMSGMMERYRGILTPAQLMQMKRQIATMPVHPFFPTLISSLVAGITVNAVAAFGEELGWRGYLQHHLRGLGFWRSSVLIGVIWGIWHAPFIIQGHNYPQHPLMGVGMMVVFCTLFGPILSYLTIRARSVFAAAVAHGTFNAAYGLSIMLIAGGNDLTIGAVGLSGFVVFAVIDVTIYFSTRSKAGINELPLAY